MFFHDWFFPTFSRPNRKNIRHTASCTFTDGKKIQHFHDSLVSGIGNTTTKHLLLSRPNATWILEDNLILIFENDNSPWNIEVCIDNAICQRLSYRFVHRRILHPCNAVQCKRLFNILDYFIVHTEKEIKQISSPVARTGLNPICPSNRRIKHFSVIQKEFRKISDNTVFLSKHQKSCNGRMQYIIFFQTSCCTDSLQIFFLGKFFPYMPRPDCDMIISIPLNCFFIQI